MFLNPIEAAQFLVDSAQRSVLFFDTLRKRGNYPDTGGACSSELTSTSTNSAPDAVELAVEPRATNWASRLCATASTGSGKLTSSSATWLPSN